MTVSAATVREAVLASLGRGDVAAPAEPSSITDETDLLLDGVLDSFGLLALIQSLEEQFNVELDFENADSDSVTMLGPFCRYVAEQCAQPSG